MNFILKFDKKFDREFKKIDKSISERMFKKIEKLEINPSSEGKPLPHTKPALWELKIDVYRVFYIIQHNNQEIWVLSVKHKDECDKYIRKGYLKDFNDLSEN